MALSGPFFLLALSFSLLELIGLKNLPFDGLSLK